MAYCDAVLTGIPLHLARRLQLVMNAAIKVRRHHAAPTPITLAESSMAYRLQAGCSGLQNVCMAWHRHTSLTNFIIQQSWGFESVCVPLRLTYPSLNIRWLSFSSRRCTIWNSLPQHITSVLQFPSSALAWRHTSSNSVTSNYSCRAREVTLLFMDTLIALTYLLRPYLLFTIFGHISAGRTNPRSRFHVNPLLGLVDK